jgi:Transglycosylase SLT domain/SPOR domain
MRCILGIFVLLVTGGAGLAAPEKIDRKIYSSDVCTIMEREAKTHNLPLEFFTRLIWRESFFNHQAISPVGAEGIAQFMPETARLRGLKDSFDYKQALPASAAYLGFLRDKFGNLGLAAAAYNFGEDGTAGWLAGRRTLPDETEDYVLAITGHNAEDWRKPETKLDIPKLGGETAYQQTCLRIVQREAFPDPVKKTSVRRAAKKPWGVMIAGGFSEAKTMKQFSRVKVRFGSVLSDELPMVVRKKDLSRGRKRVVRVMIGRDSRQDAEKLCAKLAAAGAACVVAKN